MECKVGDVTKNIKYPIMHSIVTPFSTKPKRQLPSIRQY